MARPAIHTKEVLCKILDSQCSNASYQVAAARAGCSVPSLNRWRAMSAAGNPEFILEWNGLTNQFVSLLAQARLIFMATVEAAALNRAAFGQREKVFYQGRPSWKLDHRYEGWSDQDLRDLGMTNEDRYEHDPLTNARVQHEIEHAPPVELQKAALAAYAKRWQPASHVDVNSTISLGVSMVGGNGPPKPKPIDVTTKPVQQIEHRGTPTEVEGIFNEVIEPVEQVPEIEPVEVEAAPPIPPHADPTNPITQAVRAAEAARVANLVAGLPPQQEHALPLPLDLRPDPDRDIDDITGGHAPPPPPPTMDSIAEKIHAVKKKVRDNVPMSAIERQVAAAIKRGDEAGAKTLLGYRAVPDHEGLGRGDAPAGGAQIGGAGRPGAPVKMV